MEPSGSKDTSAGPKATATGTKPDPPADDEAASESGESHSQNSANSNDNGEDADIENKDKNATNEAKDTKPSAKKKKSPAASKGTSKSYLQLVHEAIVALKDRTGSSQQAIMKYLLAQYPNLQNSNPKNNRFKQHVLTALKSGVKSGRFQKVRASFKINAEWKKKEAATQKRKKAQEIKKKKDLQKQKDDAMKEEQAKKDPVQAKIDMLREKDPDSEELKKILADRKRKEEAEARKRYIAERLKKRRFPMEDTLLHAEDKELGVKPPKDLGPRPQMPFFFSMTQNEERRSNKGYAAAASKCEGMEKGNRGLVSDMLQVYHFFRGDVHYVGTEQADREIVPDFTLKHLIFAVDDILNGTAKKARMVPPLIVHLFVTCLQILTLHPDDDTTASAEDSQQRRQLQLDFATHLHGAISPTSWADVCQLYMDAMDRHHKTDASLNKNALQSLPIDAEYLLGVTDEEADMPATELPPGYGGYLGDPDSVLLRAHRKVARHDPWLLTAEELMALLRALTDDVLARKPEIGEDISDREERMHELLKAKKAADSKFRKVRLAFEGPKKPNRKPTPSGNNPDNKAEKGDGQMDEENSPEDANKKPSDENESNGKSPKGKVEEWKPTATKKQFEAATKAQQKANDAYDKGVRILMARTEPVGSDRNFSGVYCFRHDPDVLYVEIVKPPSSSDVVPEELRPRKTSWHVIETKSLFDQYAQSLDLRGKRENSLFEELAEQSCRRFLFDDIKEKAAAAAQLKEKEDLKRRLENAKLKCDEEEGRRSGRLASRAEEELEQIEDDVKKLEQRMKSGTVVKEWDYEELTGLDMLQKFDSSGKIETRKTREKKAAAKKAAATFESMQCSKLWSTGNIDGTGFLGMLVSKMLELEETCESLVPWRRTDVTRENWISDLENLVFAWNSASPAIVGPADASSQLASPSPRPSMDMITATTPTAASETSRGSKKRPSSFGTSDSKRSKMEESPTSQSSLTVSQAVAKLRQPLLDLEKRVFEITGLATAHQDEQDADDNMSASGEEDDNADKDSKEKRAWKKLINKLRDLPSKKHLVIREVVVDAIAAARKAQLKAVVGQLRAALLEFHPHAAGACKAAAIKVLDSHGGYEVEDDDEEEEEEEANDEGVEGEEVDIPSALSADAVIVNSSLDGIEDAGHIDWVDAVKSTKTLSRMAVLVTSFVKRAKVKLEKAEEEHDVLTEAVTVWEKEEERRMKNEANGKKGRANKKVPPKEVSEVWANVEYSDEFAMVKVADYPHWPSKRCVPRDAGLAASLKSVNRCLVSLVGELGGIRVVQEKHVRPFTGDLVEEEDGTENGELTKETKTQLVDCMAMARRILRAKSTKKKG